jgi:hypothetical protein
MKRACTGAVIVQGTSFVTKLSVHRQPGTQVVRDLLYSQELAETPGTGIGVGISHRQQPGHIARTGDIIMASGTQREIHEATLQSGTGQVEASHGLVDLSHSNQVKQEIRRGIVACGDHEKAELMESKTGGRIQVIQDPSTADPQLIGGIEALTQVELAQVNSSKQLHRNTELGKAGGWKDCIRIQ